MQTALITKPKTGKSWRMAAKSLVVTTLLVATTAIVAPSSFASIGIHAKSFSENNTVETVSVADAAVTADAVYQPVDPTRVANRVAMGPDSSYTLTIPNVPAGATAVAVNVTVAEVSSLSFLSACAAGTPISTCKLTSALNPSVGEDLPSAALITLGGTNKNQVTFYNNQGTLKLIVDLQGFYVSGSASGAIFLPSSPLRVMSFQHIGPAETYTLTLPNVPAGATAVAVNITAAGTTAGSYISVCPAGQALATCIQSSSVNPNTTRDTSNFVVVKLGGANKNQIIVYNNRGSSSVIADVQGYFIDSKIAPPEAGNLHPIAPVRALAFQVMGPDSYYTLTLPNVPAGATAMVANLTTAETDPGSFISACPAGVAANVCSLSSALNPKGGRNISNNVMLKLGGPNNNQVSLFNKAGKTSLIVDVQAYFVSPNCLPTPVTDAQGYIYTETNKIRAAAGLTALEYNSALTTVAQTWSTKMATDNSLIHNPLLNTQAPATWTTLGENIGSSKGNSDNAKAILDSWMASPTHKANILNPAYTTIGIGVSIDSSGKMWATQDFAQYKASNSIAV